MLSALSKTLTSEDANSAEIRATATRFVDDVNEALNERIFQDLADIYELDEEDEAQWGSVRDIMIQHLASFLLQKPMTGAEVISERQFSYHHATKFFKGHYSPSDESNELEQLRRQNEKLQRELHLLKKEKSLVEEQALSALRRKPSRHNRPTYSSLDDMLTGMMTEAVTEGVKVALGQGKVNV